MSKLVTVLCAVIFVSVATQGQDPVNDFHDIYRASLCNIGEAEKLLTEAKNSLEQATSLRPETKKFIDEMTQESWYYINNNATKDLKECISIETPLVRFEATANETIYKSETALTEATSLRNRVRESFCKIKGEESEAESCTKQGKNNCNVTRNNAANKEWNNKSATFQSSITRIQSYITKATPDEDTSDYSTDNSYYAWWDALQACKNVSVGVPAFPDSNL